MAFRVQPSQNLSESGKTSTLTKLRRSAGTRMLALSMDERVAVCKVASPAQQSAEKASNAYSCLDDFPLGTSPMPRTWLPSCCNTQPLQVSTNANRTVTVWLRPCCSSPFRIWIWQSYISKRCAYTVLHVYGVSASLKETQRERHTAGRIQQLFVLRNVDRP